MAKSPAKDRDPSMVTADARAVGARLRAERRRAGLTLDALSKSAEVHKAYLSRLERGTRSASIATLIRLAKALNVSLAALFGEETQGSQIHVIRDSLRRPPGKALSDRFQPLAAAGPGEVLSAFMVFPTATFNRDGPATHPGHEFFFVVKGKVEIQFADRRIELSQGDALLFPGHLPHLVRRRSAAAAVLVVISKE